MDLKVADYVGFNLDPDAIHFGATSPGGVASRGVEIYHDYERPLKINIKISGKLGKWVSPSDNGFLLYPNITKEVKLKAYVPASASYGNYTGTLKVIFRKI